MDIVSAILVRSANSCRDVIPGSRLLENTSNEGFLRREILENMSAETLLRDPRELVRASGNVPLPGRTSKHISATCFNDQSLRDTYENATTE